MSAASAANGKLAADAGLDHGNVVRRQQRLRLGLTQDGAAGTKRGGDNRSRSRSVGRGTLGLRRRSLHEQRLHLVVAHDLQIRLDGFFGGGVTGHGTRAGRARKPYAFRSEPAGEGGPRRFLEERRTEPRHLRGRSHGSRRVHQQHRIHLWVFEHRTQGADIPLRRSIPDDVDRIGVRPGGG